MQFKKPNLPFNKNLPHCYHCEMRDFGDNIFEGTAEYYAKYRAAYPHQIFDDIIKKFKLNAEGRFMDLGCGTGELAIPLAKYFEKVLALDPDKQMLEKGYKKAYKLSIHNIEWQKGSSKTLTGVKGPFKLITMGQSFHWMEVKEVLEQLYRLIEDEGGVVIVGTVPTSQNKLSTDKDLVINELITKYLGPERRAGKNLYKPDGNDWEKEVFPNSAFGGFEKHDYVIRVERNLDQVIGNLFSTSFASKKLLGKFATDFESELRQKLISISNGKKFIDRVQFSAYFLAK